MLRVMIVTAGVVLWLFGATATTAAIADTATTAEKQKCTAFPVLSDIIIEVEALKSMTDTEGISQAMARIAALTRTMSDPDMLSRLSQLGLARQFDEVMRLKASLKHIIHMDRFGYNTAIPVYLRGAEFQRDYLVSQRLVKEFCTQHNQADQSDWAKRVFDLVSISWRGNQNSVGSSKGIGPDDLRSFGLIMALVGTLVGLFISNRLYRRRERRNRRLSKRVSCKISVLLAAGTHFGLYTIVDISLSGVNIENDLHLPVGTKPIVQFGPYSRTGQITWSNAKFSGVKFDTPLTTEEFAGALETCRLIKKA